MRFLNRATQRRRRNAAGASRPRAGFSLVELIVAMTLMVVLLGLATAFFRVQSKSVAQAAGRLEAQQTAAFGLATIDRELRMAGVGVADAQPMLVQADPFAVTFNADLVSNTAGDVGPVYVDVDAPDGAVSVYDKTDAGALPLSTRIYPETTYMRSAGVPSSAETISFWVARDSTSKRANEYLLWTRVNAMPPQVVARGIVINPGDTVFRYYKADTAGAPLQVASTKLPLFHAARAHGSAADTGQVALIDSIRSVRVRLTAVYHDVRQGDVTRRSESTIRVLNAGLVTRTTCGDAPLGVSPTAAYGTSAGVPAVAITWTPSADEKGGERDVERYVIFRRLTTDPSFDQPIASIPAGQSSYTFTDTDIQSGSSYIYGVAAQDCTPSSSSVGITPQVAVP